MCDLRSAFEEDRTKTADTIVNDRYFGQTHRQTDMHSSDFISVQCRALHWTDNNSSTLGRFSNNFVNIQ